ncbi:unnamed protein product [Symbiodinium sp. CCMP2456]|nr:unnamed protein product [Symbiodinium sp. CCMP2456]
MAFCQWPNGFEWKWRLLYCSLLLVLLALCFLLLHGNLKLIRVEFSAWFGLCLGLVHVPGTSAGSRSSLRCKVVICGVFTFLSTCLAGYPCVVWAFPVLSSEQENPIFKHGQQTIAFVLLSLIWICSMLVRHPRSTYVHGAKWCMFSFWLAAAAQQVTGIFFDLGLYGSYYSVFQFGWGVQCVALGWTLYLLQIRMVAIRSSVEGTCCSTSGAHIWILVMCCSWHIRHACDLDVHNTWPFIVVSLIVLCTVWVTYTILTCRSMARKLKLLLQEARRVKRGPPRKQAIWAAQVIGLEMLICLMLGLTMCSYGVLSALCVRAELSDLSDAHDVRLMQNRTELVLTALHVDWVVNSLGLGLLSGILWQGRPPKDDPDKERGLLTRGLVSMSSLLIQEEKEVYEEVVRQLASRYVRLEALLGFWERLRDGKTMPGFDPQRSLTNDVVRRAIIPESRVGDGGCALATLWSSTEVKPQVMVTHNWTNGFGSLVSAILADALGRAGYQEVSAQIATLSGFEQVRAQLTGKLETTYWV